MRDDYLVEERTVKGLKVKVYQDQDPQDPRVENDNVGKLWCLHRRQTIGDKHDHQHDDFSSYADSMATPTTAWAKE